MTNEALTWVEDGNITVGAVDVLYKRPNMRWSSIEIVMRSDEDDGWRIELSPENASRLGAVLKHITRELF